MIEFDLEKAKSGKYDLIQRDGTKIIEWCHFVKAHENDECIAALINDGDIFTFYKKGNELSDSESPNDLMLIQKKKKLYLLVWKKKGAVGHNTTLAFESLETIKKIQQDEILGTELIEIEIDEE